MSSDNTRVFTKENLDTYLNELAKQYRRLGGKAMPAEIVLVGGAAVLTNYGFRDMTTDVDAVIHAASAMKDAINFVGDKYHLPNGWLNADFMRTRSYSPKLDQHSVYYREFSHVLKVRTMAAEYLIAMKLAAGRVYKNDLSDVIGILAEHEKRGEPIQLAAIESAICDLYGSLDTIPEKSLIFIRDVIKTSNFNALYEKISGEEKEAKVVLREFDQQYPGVIQEKNMDDILETLKERKESKAAILERLKAAREDN